MEEREIALPSLDSMFVPVVSEGICESVALASGT